MSNNIEEQNCETSTETALIEGRRAFLGFLAKRLGNWAEAEDVMQEFCIRVLARKHQLRNVERMDAWLYAVLRSTLNDFGEEDRSVVATDLGLNRNALGVRLHRARTALREALLDHCGECCRVDRDDCSCPPEGCENDRHETNCELEEHIS